MTFGTANLEFFRIIFLPVWLVPFKEREKNFVEKVIEARKSFNPFEVIRQIFLCISGDVVEGTKKIFSPDRFRKFFH